MNKVFDYRFKYMLFQLENTFGKQFWNNVVLEITKYGFHQVDIEEREGQEKKSEDGITQDLNTYFKDHFKLNADVRFLSLVALLCSPPTLLFQNSIFSEKNTNSLH